MSAEHAGITNRKTVLEKSADRLGGVSGKATGLALQECKGMLFSFL